MTTRGSEPNPTRPTRAAWCLVVIAAGSVTWAYLGRTTLGELSRRPSIDRSLEADSIDPLHAAPAELQLLPGIGPELARSMHREIHATDLTTIEHLEALEGIGPVRAASIRGAIAPGTDD